MSSARKGEVLKTDEMILLFTHYVIPVVWLLFSIATLQPSMMNFAKSWSRIDPVFVEYTFNDAQKYASSAIKEHQWKGLSSRLCENVCVEANDRIFLIVVDF